MRLKTTLPGDAALLQDALARLETLNALPAVAAPRLIHRPRERKETQQQWSAGKRKRQA
jgi:hypothetical protein